MAKAEVSYKGAMELDRVAQYLDRLRASLAEGKVCVQNGDELVTLIPSKVIEVEVKASLKKSREKLSFELSWTRAESEHALEITASEPDRPASEDPEAAREEEGEPELVGAAAAGKDDEGGSKDKKKKRG